MYPYHNKIKQRIKNGELINFEFVEDYPRMGKCLVLFFSTYPFIRPIRPHRYSEYEELIKELRLSNIPVGDVGFICDRKTCNEKCGYTKDINHAKYFEERNGKYFETIKSSEDYKPRERWIYQRSFREADECRCSSCNQLMTTYLGRRMNYCPNCGARMDGKDRA